MIDHSAGTPATVGSGADVLTPVQQRTLDALRRSGEPVVFDPSLAEELRSTVDEAFRGFQARLGERTLWVSKHALSSVLGCEVLHVAPDEFAWSPPVAAGQVAHRAIQLMIHWRGDPVPSDLVDEAIARLSDADTTLGDWIAGLSPADEADLRCLAVERVTKFAECFPPLDRRAAPMTEARIQWPLEGPVVLAGKVDVVIGRPAGAESRKVIIDLKTGRASPRHRDDLRFYALVETLRTQVPPRRLASFYLDVGEPHVEDVTEALLRSATRRLLDAVDTMVALAGGEREPVKRAGVSCRWCRLAAGCAEGQAYLRGDRERADDADLTFD